MRPTRSLPQGCPASGHTLAIILEPWKPHCTRAAPPTATWTFLDDRSLKVTDHTDLPQALAATHAFDDDVGFVNNLGEQQTWHVPLAAVEHLGITCNPADPNVPVMPRDGSPLGTVCSSSSGRLDLPPLLLVASAAPWWTVPGRPTTWSTAPCASNPKRSPGTFELIALGLITSGPSSRLSAPSRPRGGLPRSGSRPKLNDSISTPTLGFPACRLPGCCVLVRH